MSKCKCKVHLYNASGVDKMSIDQLKERKMKLLEGYNNETYQKFKKEIEDIIEKCRCEI